MVNKTQKISKLYEPTAEDLLEKDEPAAAVTAPAPVINITTNNTQQQKNVVGGGGGGVKPAAAPVKPKPKVVYSPAGGRQEANRKRSTGTGTPSFSASEPLRIFSILITFILIPSIPLIDFFDKTILEGPPPTIFSCCAFCIASLPDDLFKSLSALIAIYFISSHQEFFVLHYHPVLLH